MAKLTDDGRRAKSEDGPSASSIRHAEAVRRADNVAAAGSAFANSPAQKAELRANARHGSGTENIFTIDLKRSAPTNSTKAEPTSFHHSVAEYSKSIPDDACQMLNCIVIASERLKGAELIDFTADEAASLLDISCDAANTARTFLIDSGLIAFYDNRSGQRGYRPMLGKR